jgi:hypothetical protein
VSDESQAQREDDQLDAEELENAAGELLPEREEMSIVGTGGVEALPVYEP